MGRKKKNMEDVAGVEIVNSEKNYTNIPSKSLRRNVFGLLEKTNYIFNEDGTVNWRAMVKSEYLVPNRQNFEKRKQTVPTSTEGLEDKDLLMLLAGIKELAQCRGFTSVDYQVIVSTPEFVSVKCTVCWIPNYETNNNAVCFSSLADASLNNTFSFAKNFLHTIAENRAFVRAVRNFLKIHIVGQDEIGGKTEDDSPSDNQAAPLNVLHAKLNEEPRKFKDFESFKNWAIKEGYSTEHPKYSDNEKNWDANNWTRVSDVPKGAIMDILGRLN